MSSDELRRALRDLETWFSERMSELAEDVAARDDFDLFDELADVEGAALIEDLKGRLAVALAEWRIGHGIWGPYSDL